MLGQMYVILLVGAIDEVVPPDQVLRTSQHTVTGVQQQISQADQRVLHKEAQGVLQFVAHHSHQPVHLGYFVHLPGSLINVVQASHVGSYVGTDDVAQNDHPRLPKKQAYLEKNEVIHCLINDKLVCILCLQSLFL